MERVTARMDSGGGVVVLHGVTSSGKTEVYLRAFEHALARGRRGILLVPDIALTPQMVDRVVERFGPKRVAVLHSALGAGERLDEWERARRGQVDIVVGARSAVFAPVPSLGLIVVDEEHDGSYKQDESPRYHARDVAVFRAERVGATVVLGSATPSLETYSRVESGEYEVIDLPRRIDDRPMPDVAVLDMRSELKAGKRTIFSRLLRARIEQTLDREQQVILFMNRRGFSTFVLCRECGHVMTCPHCDVSLTLHGSGSRRSELVCHYCNHTERALSLSILRRHTYQVLRRRNRADRGRGQEIFPQGASCANGCRYYAAQGGAPGDTRRVQGRAHRHSRGNTDDCQGSGFSQCHAGGSGVGRHRPESAGFSGSRADLPAHFASCRQVGKGGRPRNGGGADLQPGTLQHPGGSVPRLSGVL